MAILENRGRTSGTLHEFGGFIMSGAKYSSILVFMLMSTYLLYFSAARSLSPYLLEAPGRIFAVSSSFYDVVAGSVNYAAGKLRYLSDLETENIELKLEVARLKKLQSDIQSIGLENSALRSLLKVAEEPHLRYTTAKLLTVSSNPFTRMAVIGAGKKHNILIDQVVINSEGLVGRVVEVSDGFSKVMLITDLNSRIPVVTSESRQRGILVGGISEGKIVYLTENHGIKVGETVETSGDGKIYPAGIVVAKITGIAQSGVTASPVASLYKTDFVSVMAMGNPDSE